ncbi:hypothetical protein TL16_g03050 [Triparma laevis f. inornata]|uniref:Uncharacterized protein n=2 Tax=Triparma laevis TaxID=1534972 RepID=A0A9W7FV24_9STRA|nr:hypothetical protein TL16_g03050 [Triparma laevis f. inornata]GMI18520.1 hypothetical protein TrLO_g14874 [Triparma laevis f. longispina]
MGGVLIGLGQLTFLVFASIQCNASVPKFDWEECRRTLVSQVGLSLMVMLYVIIKLLSGVVSKHILEKHTISAKRFAAMRMNSEEFVQSVGLLISCFCALFPLGNYGAKGKFGGDNERYAAYIVPSVGAGCLVATAIWKFAAIRREINRGEQSKNQQALHQGRTGSDTPLVEASSFWVYL